MHCTVTLVTFFSFYLSLPYNHLAPVCRAFWEVFILFWLCHSSLDSEGNWIQNEKRCNTPDINKLSEHILFSFFLLLLLILWRHAGKYNRSCKCGCSMNTRVLILAITWADLKRTILLWRNFNTQQFTNSKAINYTEISSTNRQLILISVTIELQALMNESATHTLKRLRPMR